MSRCVPSWDLAEPPFPSHPNSAAPSSALHDGPMLEYEVAELTWENGQLAMHGLGPPRLQPPRATGTLESLVNQGTRFPYCKDGTDLVPWLEDHRSVAAVDALVPCSNPPDHLVGDSPRVGSCGAAATLEDGCYLPGKRTRAARVPDAREWSVSGSVPSCREVASDTHERDLGVGITPTTSHGSPENSSRGRKPSTTDEHDSVCHSTPQAEADEEEERKKTNVKSSVSTKRSRAAAIHNQSERKRRDKINQRMKTLQKLVPNSSKTDKASMLDEVIEYLKQLQAQVQMMSRMQMPAMMLPMAAIQQQLPMPSLMAPMGLGMGMGMGMGLGMGMGMGMDHFNMIAGRPAMPAGISPLLHPTAFMPMAAWDGGTCDQFQAAPPPMMADPLSAFLACQSQPMNMEAYNRIAAMFQQLHKPPAAAGSSKN